MLLAHESFHKPSATYAGPVEYTMDGFQEQKTYIRNANGHNVLTLSNIIGFLA